MDRDKQERKIKRWTETPEAKARHAETLARIDAGYAWSWPKDGPIADGHWVPAVALPVPPPAGDPPVLEPPPGYTAEELERDNPYNAWMYDGIMDLCHKAKTVLAGRAES